MGMGMMRRHNWHSIEHHIGHQTWMSRATHGKKWIRVCGLNEKPISLLSHKLLQLVQRPRQLLTLRHLHVLDWRLPPAMPLARPPHPVELFPSLPLGLQLVGGLSQLGIELPHVGVAVSLNELHGAGALVVGRWVPGQEAVYHSLHAGVAEGKDLPARREDYDGYFSAAQGA